MDRGKKLWLVVIILFVVSILLITINFSTRSYSQSPITESTNYAAQCCTQSDKIGKTFSVDLCYECSFLQKDLSFCTKENNEPCDNLYSLALSKCNSVEDFCARFSVDDVKT